jgi:hypothetical protein
LSQHPVDIKIRELIAARRLADPGEIERIVERMATAPFNPGQVVVPLPYRGLTHLGRSLGSHAPADFFHLVERVAVDAQWAAGTTLEDYLADLRRAVQWPKARLALYRRRGGAIVAAVSSTSDIVPISRQGLGSQPWLIVLYSAERGILISGYQFSSFARVSIPGDAQWLR